MVDAAAQVDLSDLIPDFRSMLNVPGGTLYASAPDGEMLSRLRNAFWFTVNDGLIHGYTVDDDGIVSPIDVSNVTPLGRDIQQIVMYYGQIQILRVALQNAYALFRAKAGDLEYETQQSATLMKALLDETVRQRDLWLERLSDLGHIPAVVIDGVLARNDSIIYGDTQWLNGSMIAPPSSWNGWAGGLGSGWYDR